MNIEKAISQLKKHEGFRGKPYLDSVGKTTIGYGRNLDDNPLTEEEATYLLRNDVQDALDGVSSLVDIWEALNGARQAVLLNMAFNLGIPRLRKFKRMLAAVEAQDFEKAAEEMQDSRWYHQVKSRAVELCEQMRTGAYQ